jgi:hypothetical protein
LPQGVQQLLVSHQAANGKPIAYALRYPLPEWAKRDEIRSAMAVVERTCQSARREVVAAEITRCLLVTKARAGDDDDMRARVRILTEELAEFPGDVIREACRRWSRESPWAPSLHELRHECAKAFGFRSTLLESLRRAVARFDQ